MITIPFQLHHHQRHHVMYLVGVGVLLLRRHQVVVWIELIGVKELHLRHGHPLQVLDLLLLPCLQPLLAVVVVVVVVLLPCHLQGYNESHLLLL
jgi:hypothetical protein